MQYIDYLGNPVTVGDIFIRPVAYGSSSAHLTTGRVEEIIPIVKLPNGRWTLETYRRRSNPTEYQPHGRYILPPGGDWRRDRKFIPDPQRSYVIRARSLERKYIGPLGDPIYHDQNAYGWRWSGGKPAITKNVDRIVVVTRLIGDQELAAQVAEANAHPPYDR